MTSDELKALSDATLANLYRSGELVHRDEVVGVLKLALEYWADRQQRYKNRHPVWVQNARALLASIKGNRE